MGYLIWALYGCCAGTTAITIAASGVQIVAGCMHKAHPCYSGAHMLSTVCKWHGHQKVERTRVACSPLLTAGLH